MGCERPFKGAGLCFVHYARVRRRGYLGLPCSGAGAALLVHGLQEHADSARAMPDALEKMANAR